MNNYIQFLNSSERPEYFYNIIPDIVKYLKVEIPPVLHPVTKQPVTPEDLKPLFPMELIKQEVSAEESIEIPDEIQEIYASYRPTPMIRARGLEKALGTPARIYFKYEGTTPSGSHKINTALVQAYYSKKEGVKNIVTETGAGQWGTALSIACNYFDLKCKVYMVRISYEQKPHRKTIMKLFGADIISSPSMSTEAGKGFLKEDPNTSGSLGMAISEAVEVAAKREDTKYALGSVLNHVLLHQTVVGQEAEKQMEKFGDYPDIVIGCVGGGSNFAGFAFPFVKNKLREKRKTEFIAVEPESCPSLTKGKYKYDFGDSAGMTPLVKMHTLGHKFVPDPIHAGGLRYHGMAPLLSLLKDNGVINAVAYGQKEVFEAAKIFAQTEGIVPAPESAHAIKAAIEQALKAKKEGTKKIIAFNLSGHGHFDMQAYEKFLDGKIS
ncbi:MAG: Tryptophan synthase beta chain [candidate division WS6 bacterium GW2011_GWA2_37_6]|uniref:Tryptophan synthase beta chain n=1 Tax=candidate division WS6 bacterium GW2011_GWA2_37_6 TaxID=1619087 RepID=A0A0G0K5W7_9BACT|nr:MAG: Tryptophan synthase beta chain [candidate division WS6 bacterium GW2011_GWA2_37_6]